MEFEKPCREGEACRGVIKKLFPSKRYGFAVCECAKHTGEAHFNYSDLDLPEQERSCLAVGWRIDFNVVEQHKKTDHCDYRAIQVKPVEVMVVQCEVTDVWENEIAILTCRELTGKTIYVTRNKYNGKFESEAVARRDTCRAAVTWEQMKQKKTFALHCSQDTVSPTTVSPFRPKFKTPEKRLRRTDGHSVFTDSLMTTSSSSGYLDDIFMQSVCDHSDMLVTRSAQNSGLETPEEHHQSSSSSASRSFGGPVIRVLSSTPTHKGEKNGQSFDSSGGSSGRYAISAKTSPNFSQSSKANRTNSTGSVGSNSGNHGSSHIYGNKFPGASARNINQGDEGKNSSESSVRSSDGTGNGSDDHSGGGGGHQLPRRAFSPVESFAREHRSATSRRNLDREFETFCGSPRNNHKTSHSAPVGMERSYPESTSKMMSMLVGHDQNRTPETTCDSAIVNDSPRRFFSDSLFGLYDANTASDEVNIYSVRNLTQHNPYRPWEIPPNNSSPSNPEEQLNQGVHRVTHNTM